MKNIKLVALDLDGTLFNKESIISKRNLDTIKKASELGIAVVISTGRPLNGLPFDQIKGSGIRYAITANGSAIYELETKKCLREEAMDEELFLPIVEYLLTKDIHMDAFIGGNGYSPLQCVKNGERLVVPEALKHYILHTRTRVQNLPQFIRDNHLRVQKMTLNFYPDENGVYKTARKSSNIWNPIRASQASAVATTIWNSHVRMSTKAWLYMRSPKFFRSILTKRWRSATQKMTLRSLKLQESVLRWAMPHQPSRSRRTM